MATFYIFTRYYMTTSMNIFRDLVNLLFPHRCIMCKTELNTGEKCLCASCLMMLPRTDYHLVEHSNLEKRFWTLFPIERAISFFHYDALKVRQLIWHGKYYTHPKVGKQLAMLYAEEVKADSDFFTSIDCIIPMPLHWRREFKRKYNQCHYIAKGVKAMTGIPIYEDVVKRVVNNISQTKVHGSERKDNVKGIFRLIKPNKISGKHILIVDDVLTTGATITSLAQELAKAENVRISVLTLAVASRVPVPSYENDEPDHKVFGNLLME